MHDAVVIGAGHNGLVAANVLADAGWSVLVVEAEDEPGGAVRSGELIEPGFVNDRFSAFYPLAAASPVFRSLGLEIPFRHGPLVLAHPALDALTLFRRPDDPFAARIREGNALHTDCPPWSLAGRIFGVLLTELGRRYGFPCVERGSGTITRLLVERALARGVELRLGERVDRVPAANRAVIAAIDVWELARITGRTSRVERDPATTKVDWTLDGPIPWTADDARRAPVVHLGGPGAFVLFGQYSMADPTRSPAGKEIAWAYSHTLPGAEAIERLVERYAPGFGVLVRGRRVEELPPGRVNLGTSKLRNELFLRPFHGRPEAGLDGVYLASASAHPGGAVHGAPGWIAAQAALRAASRRRPRGLASFTISSR